MIQKPMKAAGLSDAIAGRVDPNIVRIILQIDGWPDYALILPNPPDINALVEIQSTIDEAVAAWLNEQPQPEPAQEPEPAPKPRRTRKKKAAPEE